jgi:hypothetical protein
MANKPTPKKSTAKKATPKKAAAKKAPAKKASAKKATPKKVAAKKATAKKSAPKVAKAATGDTDATATITDVAEKVWDAFNTSSSTSTANVSATVNGHVIYANDVKPAALRKRFLAWFKK